MKHIIGMSLSVARHVINVVTVLVALAYALFFSAWMHAPLLEVLAMTMTIASLPLTLAWFTGRIGSHLRRNTPLLPSSPAARGLLAVGGLVVLVTCAMVFVTQVKRNECRADPSRTAAAREQDGFERVCEGDLARFDISLGSLKRAVQKLAFSPVDLTHTPFARFEALGGKAERINEVPSRLYRGFRTPDGHRIILSEHDMSVDGVRTWRNPKDEPERIDGLPARLAVMEDPAGNATSVLSWVEGRRAYELWIDANVVTKSMRGHLLALAASLPKSVPGCPNEVLPKSLRIGDDGTFDDEPIPQVLTQTEVDAISDERIRPCR